MRKKPSYTAVTAEEKRNFTQVPKRYSTINPTEGKIN